MFNEAEMKMKKQTGRRWLMAVLIFAIGCSGGQTKTPEQVEDKTHTPPVLVLEKHPGASVSKPLERGGTLALSSIRGGWSLLLHVQDDLGGQRDGWWEEWHAHKDGDPHNPGFSSRMKPLPHTYTNLKSGEYVLIVYDPSGGPNNNSSDGVVLDELKIHEGQRLNINLKDADYIDWSCLSCPWLYAWDGKNFVKHFEILSDVVGEAQRETRVYDLPGGIAHQGRVTLQIREEKDELTHLDQLTLSLAGHPVIAPVSVNGVKRAELDVGLDGQEMLLRKGDQLTVVYELPEGVDSQIPLKLTASGYYDPDAVMLSEFFETHRRKHP